MLLNKAADLSSTEVNLIEGVLDQVEFDNNGKYKRNFIQSGTIGVPGDSVFFGCTRGGSGVSVATRNPANQKAIKKLNEVMRERAVLDSWTSMCINVNTKSDWHVDKMNIGYSAIMCFGDFVHGGEFVLRGEDGEDVKYDVRNKVMIIDGKKPHSSTPFAGWRVSVVFFCHSHHSSCKDRSFLEDELGFLFPPSKGVMDQIADAELEQIADAELEQIEAALIEVHIADDGDVDYVLQTSDEEGRGSK
jgi:hypothetical protein